MITRFLYFQKTEIKVIPKILPKIKIASKTGKEKKRKELKNIPKIKKRQKYKNIFEGVIILILPYLTNPEKGRDYFLDS